ncbi:hypothetical protein [Intrasporangium sp.]|uniref:hypothetical protein n=1 Tax=Intrasporangium sp. TaxID=1925024 RepID=UPI00293B4870|nr:hypothetical protein [Intrasporangium sp.]MDV3221189.1 hypothetical protein [Intrasporangium sp.]
MNRTSRSATRPPSAQTPHAAHDVHAGHGGRPGTTVSSRVVPTDRSVVYGVLALATMSVAGAGISVSSGLSTTFLDAMGPVGRLSIPWTMVLFQIGMGALAASRQRVRAMAGSGFVALGLVAGIVSGFFDGGYSDPRLSVGERGYQFALIVGLALVAGIAVRRFLRSARSDIVVTADTRPR